MKVEEIKLALEKNREHHVQFGMLQDSENIFSKMLNDYMVIRNEVNAKNTKLKDIIAVMGDQIKVTENMINQSKSFGLDISKLEKNKSSFQGTLKAAIQYQSKLQSL